MTVNITDIQDYLTWRQNVNSRGVDDSIEAFAWHRERLDQEGRIEETLGYLKTLIEADADFSVGSIQRVYQLLTGVEYRPDDV